MPNRQNARAQSHGFARDAWRGSSVGSCLAVACRKQATRKRQRFRGKVAGFKFLRNPVWLEAQNPGRHLFSFREAVPTVP